MEMITNNLRIKIMKSMVLMKVFAVAALLMMAGVAEAQKTADKGTKLFIRENQLVSKGKEKTIVSVDLTIPADNPRLQAYLTGMLFGGGTGNMEEAYENYLSTFDKVKKIDNFNLYNDNHGAERAVRFKASRVGYDPGWYVSYYWSVEEAAIGKKEKPVGRTEIEEQLISKLNDRHSLGGKKVKGGSFIYDLERNSFLTVNDVFVPAAIKAYGLDTLGYKPDMKLTANYLTIGGHYDGDGEKWTKRFLLAIKNEIYTDYFKELTDMPQKKLSDVAFDEKMARDLDSLEQMPSFPGGDASLAEWLHDNVKYPAIAKEHGVQGNVQMRFLVEKDGSLSHVSVIKNVDPSLDREASRVVKAMPKWVPGVLKGGEKVAMWYTLPVTFRLK